MSSSSRRRKPLLEGRSAWRLDEVCAQRGIELDQLMAVIDAGHFADAVLYDESGRPVLLFEDEMPTERAFGDLIDQLGRPST